MRVVFMGTPDFAVPPLKALTKRFDVVGVFTQPDKPRGRNQVMTPPEVKVCALERGLDVFQPATLKGEETLSLLKELDPDVIVVAAFGKILPKAILDLPRLGCVNIHASLLPKYRGSAPIQRAVLDGEKETGVTIMLMNEGIDTGDMLFKQSVPIGISDTAESMFEKLSELGAEMITPALEKIERGEISPIKQDESVATYAPMLDRSICEIDWKKPCEKVHDLVRGLYSWPVAHTIYQGKKLKIFSSYPETGHGKPGEVISLSPLLIACGDGALRVDQLQLEGKKRMSAEQFVIGHPTLLHEVLGE